ncbi:MAG: ABC transporter ATP-binding protein [Candidatus Zixiibacteriota bacterium]|nr:MAG: ABC transporter ATP-binding protein [candidate division Zixibacteria bacterium]
MKVIEIKSLTKIYNETEIPVYATNNITLDFEEGEFSALIGPSGSGKTTLLNLIGGLDKPTSGSVIIDKTDITGLSSRKLIDFRLHNIGFVFQAYNLIPVLTAKENIEFIMQLQNKPKAERETRVMELLEAVGIPEKKDSRPLQMSGGQQQRVAVARALASKPKFVLADEPTANLDSKSTETLLDIMRQLNEKENITFIFSTHDQRVIDRAKRLIYLEDGKVMKDTKI